MKYTIHKIRNGLWNLEDSNGNVITQHSTEDGAVKMLMRLSPSK